MAAISCRNISSHFLCQHKFLHNQPNTVIIVGRRDIIRRAPHRQDRILHGNTETRVLDHREVIVTVPTGNHLFFRESQDFQQALQALSLIDSFRQNLKKERV